MSESEIRHKCDPDGECFCVYDADCNPAVAAGIREREDHAAALLNDRYLAGSQGARWDQLAESEQEYWRSAVRDTLGAYYGIPASSSSGRSGQGDTRDA